MAYPAIAPMMSVPSWPRLIRPLFSVRHSPRLTKINGVLARVAPANSASGTPHSPMSVKLATLHLPPLEDLEPAIKSFEGEDHQEQKPLQHQHSCIGKMLTPLQQPTAGADTANEDGNGNDGQRIG